MIAGLERMFRNFMSNGMKPCIVACIFFVVFPKFGFSRTLIKGGPNARTDRSRRVVSDTMFYYKCVRFYILFGFVSD